MTISDYLDERLVLFLESSSRNEALEEMVLALERAGKLRDAKQFHSALLEREGIVSTGVGLGVAIPHAKLKDYSDFFITVGILKNQGLEWNSLDGNAVRLIFLIGGPDHKQTEYLSILSRLTCAIKSEERRKKLLRATHSNEVIALLAGC